MESSDWNPFAADEKDGNEQEFLDNAVPDHPAKRMRVVMPTPTEKLSTDLKYFLDYYAKRHPNAELPVSKIYSFFCIACESVGRVNNYDLKFFSTVFRQVVDSTYNIVSFSDNDKIVIVNRRSGTVVCGLAIIPGARLRMYYEEIFGLSHTAGMLQCQNSPMDITIASSTIVNYLSDINDNNARDRLLNVFDILRDIDGSTIPTDRRNCFLKIKNDGNQLVNAPSELIKSYLLSFRMALISAFGMVLPPSSDTASVTSSIQRLSISSSDEFASNILRSMPKDRRSRSSRSHKKFKYTATQVPPSGGDGDQDRMNDVKDADVQ